MSASLARCHQRSIADHDRASGRWNSAHRRLPKGLLDGLDGHVRTLDRDAAVWASPDGTSWEPVTPDLPRGSGPGDQRLLDAVVVGDRLHLLGSDVPPGGGGPHTVAVPVPGLDDGS